MPYIVIALSLTDISLLSGYFAKQSDLNLFSSINVIFLLSISYCYNVPQDLIKNILSFKRNKELTE